LVRVLFGTWEVGGQSESEVVAAAATIGATVPDGDCGGARDREVALASRYSLSPVKSAIVGPEGVTKTSW